MLALFVTVKTITFRLRKIRTPFAEPQYSTDHVFTIRFRTSLLVTTYNKYESYHWTRRRALVYLLSRVCHYAKHRLCVFMNIHHYAAPIGCSVRHEAATSLALQRSDVLVSSFKSIK